MPLSKKTLKDTKKFQYQCEVNFFLVKIKGFTDYSAKLIAHFFVNLSSFKLSTYNFQLITHLMSLTLERLNELCKSTLIEHLGIEFLEISEGKVYARMPVDSRTMQTMRKLHGGASMALAETVGGAGSMCLVDNNEYAVLGIEISGSHVGNTSEPFAYAQANIISQGKSTHVWEIRIQDSKGGLISLCRLTNRIILKKHLAGK